MNVYSATRAFNRPNQDAVLASATLACVFDGAGNAGQIADRLKRVPCNGDLRAWVGQLHSTALGSGFECCVLAVTNTETSLQIVSAGDCRMYLWHPDGHLELAVSQKTPRLGASGLSPLFAALPIVPKSIAILLTDGVWSGLAPYRLQKLIAANVLSVPELAERIIAAAGATEDDKSTVIIKC